MAEPTAGSSWAGDVTRLRCNTGYSNRVVLVGTLGEIQTSDDHGDTWTRRLSASADGTFKDLCSPSNGVWLATTQTHSVYRSADNGTTWNKITLHTDATIQAAQELGECFAVLQGTVGYFTKHTTENRRLMWLSWDGGLTWRAGVRLPVNGFPIAAAAHDFRRAVVVGSLQSFDTSSTSFVLASTIVPSILPAP